MTALLTADQVTAPGWYWWRLDDKSRWTPIEVTPCVTRENVMTFSPDVEFGAHVDLYGFFVKAAVPDEPSAPAEDLPRLDAPISELVAVLADSVIPPAERAVAALDAVTAAAMRARAAVATIAGPVADSGDSVALVLGSGAAKPPCIVFNPAGHFAGATSMCVYLETDAPEFFAAVARRGVDKPIGYLRFVRCGEEVIMKKTQWFFELREVLPSSYPVPHPVISLSGVLRTRPAAREADQVISTFLAEQDQTLRSSGLSLL